MTLREIAATGRSISGNVKDDNWVSDVIAFTQRLEADLADTPVFQEVVEGLLAVAQTTGAASIVGASALGDRLAGAVSEASEGAVRLGILRGSTVLVVDPLLASGAQLARTIRRAVSAGAGRTVGAAAVADSRALDAIRQDTGVQVVALTQF